MRLIKAACAAQLKEFYWRRPSLLCRCYRVPFHYYVKRCPRLFGFAANNALFFSPLKTAWFFPDFSTWLLCFSMFPFFVISRRVSGSSFFVAVFFAPFILTATWIGDFLEAAAWWKRNGRVKLIYCFYCFSLLIGLERKKR